MLRPHAVAILGAGALGAVYASRFYAHHPACVALVAGGERRERLLREGIVLNGARFDPPLRTPGDSAPPADLVIVALKHQHLADSLPDLRTCVGPDTLILSVMNGLDSEEIIAAEYGWEKVLHCIALGIDAVRDGNCITYSKIGRLVFGEARNETLSPRVLRAQAILSEGGIPFETPIDMLRMMWWKFMINVGVNQASAVLRAPYRAFQTSPHAQAIMEAAMREVIALAGEMGIDLAPSAIEEWYPVLNTLHPAGKTSMLQDVEAGRVTEVDIFAGKVIALGQVLSIPTPVNTLLFHAIKAIEQSAQDDDPVE